MTTVLAHRKYRLALRWAAEVGKTFGLWTLIAFAVLHLVQLGLRLSTSFEGDMSFYLLRYLPFVLTAVGLVYLLKAFPLAIAAGLTRKEFFAAFAVFSGIAIAGGVAVMQLVKLVHNLFYSADGGGLDLYGATLLETLIRMAVYFTAGAAAGALLARFDRRASGGILAGAAVSVLIFRTIPFQLLLAEFPEDVAFAVEYPGSEELLAPFDAVLTVLFVLVVWLTLARAPLPHKKG
ncbi:hypothetical protein K3N28_15210 [Glycomyces sp. TRM65418]|uniref:hypothetical protein n=1 Tax=Glycomyces sp. TRM65418 TaxID=2867006 RepID=UPI001CE64301|nr:hypothetical protein [Glycomyces sp. TRM65418]MCC3764414.1 hypothetical protein [Glycomyces sp. TRM65418]QZD54090.1 hypothetical protein K3N28_15135 [Glycomyces sp. TRM65418]